MNRLKPEVIWRIQGLEELEILNNFHNHTVSVKFFSCDEHADEIYNGFIRYIEPFIYHYPWNNQYPQFDIFEHNGWRYLYGELVFDDNINDEWILVRLCWEYSRSNPGVFISLWDSLDNELLLVQAYKVIQDWMNPGNSSNRPWIVGGDVVIVAQENHDYMPLEAVINSLERGDYTKDIPLTHYYNDWLKKAKTYFFESIYDIELNLPKLVVDIFIQSPFLISRCIQKYHTEKIQLKRNMVHVSDDQTISVKLGVPLLSLSIVKENQLAYQEQNNENVEFNILMEYMLIKGLDLLSREEPELIGNHSLEQNGQYSPSRIFLQEKLIAMNRLKRVVPNDEEELNKLLNFVPGYIKADDEIDNELINKLSEFFEDQNAGLEGINNQKFDKNASQPQSESEDENNGIQDIQKLEEELGEDFSDFIDFCMEQRGNHTQSSKRKRKINELKEYNNESDYHTDTSTEYLISSEDEEQEQDFLNDPRFKKLIEDNESVEALTKLLSSIKTDEGPGSILLEQGIKNAK